MSTTTVIDSYYHESPGISVAFMKENTNEWFVAWDKLSNAILNSMLPDPMAAEDTDSGEVWQYMGTIYNPLFASWHHEFRHRMHPKTKGRETYRVDAIRPPLALKVCYK